MHFTEVSKVTCSSVCLAVSVVYYQKVVANRRSLLIVYLCQLFYEATKNHIFLSLANVNVKIATLPTVNPCVTIDRSSNEPIYGHRSHLVMAYV